LETHSQVTGTIAPIRETFIGPKVSGRIEEFFVDEGDFVGEGMVLVKLEQIRFSLALKEARAAREESLADLRNLERKLSRYKTLHEKGVVEKEAFDDIATQVDLARSRLEINLSRLEEAQEDLKDSLLKAPFAGFVVERRMNTSELYTGVAGEYIFHIIDTSTVEVEVDIFETKRKYLSQGKRVTVRVDALPGKEFEGTITVINPYIDPVSRKFLIKVAIPNKDYALESGMFARVSIPEEQRRNALLLPARAVVERNGKKVVFTTASGRAQEQAISIGLTTHELVEVLEGLSEGDSVIVDGMYAVKDTTPVVVSAKQQQPQL
jgi:membrane fusion protein (multidrug efflux system)